MDCDDFSSWIVNPLETEEGEVLAQGHQRVRSNPGLRGPQVPVLCSNIGLPQRDIRSLC